MVNSFWSTNPELLIWSLSILVFSRAWQVAKQAVHVLPQGVQERCSDLKSCLWFGLFFELVFFFQSYQEQLMDLYKTFEK